MGSPGVGMEPAASPGPAPPLVPLLEHLGFPSSPDSALRTEHRQSPKSALVADGSLFCKSNRPLPGRRPICWGPRSLNLSGARF